MLYGLYVSAAGALANSYRQDVVANNLANVNTVAFKRDLALVQGRQTQSDQGGQRQFTDALLEGIGGGIFALPTHTDFSPAGADITDREFDLALEGPGFFQVRKGDQVHYTRDGRFALDDQNRLVTYTDHLPVLDDAGSAIVLDPKREFKVNQAGVISQDGASVASLGVVDTADKSQIRKLGNNLYALDGGKPKTAESIRIKQGALENSGVNAIKEITDQMRTLRLFQTNMSMIQLQDQSLGLAVSRLANVS